MITSPDRWWGEFSLDVGATVQWEIGPFRIAVQRLPGEWFVGHEQIEPTEGEQEWRVTSVNLDVNENEFVQVARFVCQNTPGQITASPALADRPVVTRPFKPFTVPADENATIYVSTPLWFSLAAGKPPQLLLEHPIQRPSDTWFGPSTQEGEVCYASQTYGRLNLENLAVQAHRALTQVQIHNKSAVPLLIERINLPVPYLSLFATTDGALWTEAVTMIQTREASLAEFNIEKEPPTSAAGSELIIPPRQKPHTGMLIRTFSALKLQGFD